MSEYIDKLERKKERKIEDVEADIDFKKFTRSMSDEEINIYNCNQRNLQKDPAYNSKTASDRLRQAIRDRKLTGLYASDEEFLEEYKLASVGMPLPAKEITDLARVEEKLDIVPTQETKRIIALATTAGHTTDYLLQKAREYDIDLGTLNDLVYLKDKHKTNFPTMLSLFEKGYTPTQIDEFFETRDNVAVLASGTFQKQTKPSLTKIVELAETFPGLDYAAGSLAEAIEEIHGTLQSKYVDQSIEIVIDIANQMGVSDMDTILDFLSGHNSPYVLSTEEEADREHRWELRSKFYSDDESASIDKDRRDRRDKEENKRR